MRTTIEKLPVSSSNYAAVFRNTLMMTIVFSVPVPSKLNGAIVIVPKTQFLLTMYWLRDHSCRFDFSVVSVKPVIWGYFSRVSDQHFLSSCGSGSRSHLCM